MTTNELLGKYNIITKEHRKERALYNLLRANEKYIIGLIEEDATGNYLHKALRQIDVCDSSYMDMAIWILLGEAELFWKMLDEEINGNKNGFPLLDEF